MVEENPKIKDRVQRLQENLDKDYLPLSLQNHLHSKKNQSLYLDENANPVKEEELPPTNQLIFSSTGEKLPFDISGKSISELQEMGFQEITNFHVKRDPISKGLQPHLTADDRERMRKAIDDMKKDEEDPEYFQDDIDFDFHS